MTKAIKYSILTAVVLISLYGSVYIKPLDKVKDSQNELIFDAKSLAQQFMQTKAPTITTINATTFLKDITNDVKKYSEEKGKRLGISNDYYFSIDGEGTVTAIEDEYVTVRLNNSESKEIKIATDFIFGNAIREASEIADIGDFQNTMDYNTISVELNNIIRDSIIPPFKNKVKIDDVIAFKGAIKVNSKKSDLNDLRMIPTQLTFKN